MSNKSNNKVNTKKLTKSKKIVVENVKKFVNENSQQLLDHYNSVIDRKRSTKNHTYARNNCIYEDVELDEFNSELLKVSIVVLTANFFECEILKYNVARDYGINIKRLKDGINVFPCEDFKTTEAFIMEINKYKVLHLHAPETGSNTPCGSTDLVRYIGNNNYLFPKCIISFGICYGIDPVKQKLGDTIIANKIYPCSIGIKIDDKGWSIKHDDYVLNLQQSFNKLYHRIQNVVDGGYSENEFICCDVQMGNMLTGEAVISNEKTKIAAIQKSHTCSIVGGEMEGYGIAKECIYYEKIPCIILKAICDWGSCKNIDSYLGNDIPEESRFDCKGQIQAYTAYCAYTVLKQLIHNEIVESTNICDVVLKAVEDKYYKDGYVQDSYLKSFLTEFLSEQIEYAEKYKKALKSDEFIDFLIDQSLIKTEFAKKCINQKIIGYKMY